MCVCEKNSVRWELGAGAIVQPDLHTIEQKWFAIVFVQAHGSHSTVWRCMATEQVGSGTRGGCLYRLVHTHKMHMHNIETARNNKSEHVFFSHLACCCMGLHVLSAFKMFGDDMLVWLRSEL